MKNIAVVVFVLILVLIGIICFQNFSQVSVKLLVVQVSMPLPLLIIGAYLLGMITGYTVLKYFRNSIKTVQQTIKR